jgi:Rrf2 family protein
MINISRKIEYALMILNYYQETMGQDQALTAREISQGLGIPFDTTSKVLQRLNNDDIVTSTQGVKGGYVLNRPLSAITYKNLYDSIEGNTTILKCESGAKACEYMDKCSIIPPLRKLSHLTTNFYQQITVQDLLREEHDN